MAAGDRKPCANGECEETISPSVDSDLCFSCASALQRSATELFTDLDKVLRLEAEFRQWCLDNGQPDPHE